MLREAAPQAGEVAHGAAGAHRPPLHRHQLVRLHAAGWRAVRSRDWDDVARDCLMHWAAHGLPLVVTRQPAAAVTPRGSARAGRGFDGGADHVADGVASTARASIALGLPAPGRWDRRRIALSAAMGDVDAFDEFPPLCEALGEIPGAAARAGAARLDAALAELGLAPRAHGSVGWQRLTGLPCVRPGSDLDLWMSVADAAQADAASRTIQGHAPAGLHVDAELMFGDGRAVAAAEWEAWRAGRVATLLVKTLHGPALIDSDDALAAASAADEVAS